MRQRALTRRVVLRGTAAAAVAASVAGCSGGGPAPGAAPTPRPPDAETVLLTGVIADKEQMVALYRQAARANAKTAARLQPFQQRHEAHLAELRRRLPAPASPPAGTPTPSASAGGSPSAAAVSIGTLRQMEGKAAAARLRQVRTVSAPLAQLLASIGACEAAHAAALARPR